MLDLNFIADGALPLPGPAGNPHDLADHNVAPVLSAAIRDKADQIMSLLVKTRAADAQSDYNLSLAEEIAHEITDLCPETAATIL